MVINILILLNFFAVPDNTMSSALLGRDFTLMAYFSIILRENVQTRSSTLSNDEIFE